MLKDLRNLSDAEQQEYLDRFIMANEEQKFPQDEPYRVCRRLFYLS